MSFSALQRAEIAEIGTTGGRGTPTQRSFSALQRAEIAEIFTQPLDKITYGARFSALQRAEIAEISTPLRRDRRGSRFQCSSTSRNC